VTIVTIFDCETTGRLHPDHRIIEASFRMCSLEEAREINHTLLRFNPERHIEARATAVHGITDDAVKVEPTFCDVLDCITDILNQTHIMVYHNGDEFDLKFLQQEFERCRVAMPEFETFDTMKEGNWATDLGKSPTLSELCWSLDVDYDSKLAHSGHYDTMVLRDAFFNGIRLGWFLVSRS
jgi:DNA polymerase-3 subunit epsilon